MALFDELGGMLTSGSNLGALSGFLGSDDDQTKGVVGAAVPALLGGLGKRAEAPGGADALFGMVSGNDGSMLDNIGGLLGGGDQGGVGSNLVGSILGGRRGAVEAGIAQSAGVGGGMVTKLLPMLAPMVMGFLGKKVAGGGLNAGGLASMLGENTRAMQGGGLGNILGMLDGGDDETDNAGFLGGLDKLKGMGGLGALGGLGAAGAGAAAMASGVGGKLGDTTRGVTGKVGDVTGDVSGKLGDTTRGVTGKVGDVGGRRPDVPEVKKGGMGWLKWLLPVLALIALAVILFSVLGGDDDGDSASSGNVGSVADLGGQNVSVGVENAYLPYNYIPIGESEGAGWDYDAWREICRLINCTPEFVEAGWPAVIDQVAQGDLDTAADGISITAERAEIVDYSDPYMTVQQKFIVALENDVSSADDIIGGDYLIGTQVGTTNYELAQELVGDDRISAFDQFGLAIQALVSGDVDAVIIDDAAGLGYVGENADQIRTVDDGLQSDPLGFIFPQGSELVGPVNDAIAEMKSSGFMEQLGRKYFTDEFSVTYDDIEG